VDADEPERVAQAVKILGLKHAVVTSVTRDDLPDGGAAQFAEVIRIIRLKSPGTTIEVLTPDFKGNEDSIRIVMDAAPDVYNHNVETVPRLYNTVRPAALYKRSLDLLRIVSESGLTAKSGVMVGLGETEEELSQVFMDLSLVGVTMLTIGQYLSPSAKHHPVVKYYTPEEFDTLADKARQNGIKSVFAAPLVRSSYHAGETFGSK